MTKKSVSNHLLISSRLWTMTPLQTGCSQSWPFSDTELRAHSGSFHINRRPLFILPRDSCAPRPRWLIRKERSVTVEVVQMCQIPTERPLTPSYVWPLHCVIANVTNVLCGKKATFICSHHPENGHSSTEYGSSSSCIDFCCTDEFSQKVCLTRVPIDGTGYNVSFWYKNLKYQGSAVRHFFIFC